MTQGYHVMAGRITRERFSKKGLYIIVCLLLVGWFMQAGKWLHVILSDHKQTHEHYQELKKDMDAALVLHQEYGAWYSAGAEPIFAPVSEIARHVSFAMIRTGEPLRKVATFVEYWEDSHFHLIGQYNHAVIAPVKANVCALAAQAPREISTLPEALQYLYHKPEGTLVCYRHDWSEALSASQRSLLPEMKSLHRYVVLMRLPGISEDERTSRQIVIDMPRTI